MRVLTVGNRPPDPREGGLEVVWADLIDGLRARGHEIQALHPPRLPAFWKDGEWRASGPIRAFALDRRARRVLREDLAGADVLLWATLGGLPLSLLEEARRVRVPQVGLIHDSWMLYAPRHDRWHRLRRASLADLARDVLWCANSAFTRDGTLAEVALDRVEVVSPGVDLQRFVAAPPRERWGGELVYVGRLGPEKGIRHAVRALPELPETTLTVHGPSHPAEEAELRRLAAEGGVAERLRLDRALSRHDVPAAYAAADAVVFPVVWAEPWGLVPLEAMAVGRPVIATGTGGSAEYLRDGENCLLVKPFDAAAIAAAVRRLAEDAPLRLRLREAGLVTAQEHDQATFVARQADLIEAEASRAGAAAAAPSAA